MNQQILKLVLCFICIQCGLAAAGEADRIRFDGEGNGRTATFDTDGPWLLDWSIHSDMPLPTNFEMRLHDATSGDFIATLVQLEGTGQGQKLFVTGGDYQIAVVADNIAWELEVSEVTDAQAAEIIRWSEGKPSLDDSVRQVLRRVRESSFSEWRPQGNDTLLLYGDGGIGWRATFAAPCPGLKSATAISFVTPATGGMNDYDSILLDDGTRCYFDRVVPARLN